MEDKFDVAIIGTGPAGLSAAITLKIRKIPFYGLTFPHKYVIMDNDYV